MKKVNVAVVGATGLVGSTIVKILEERKLQINEIYFFASKKSAGNVIVFNGKEHIVEELKGNSFEKKIDIALFAAGGAVSQKYAPIAVKKGVIVIDNSSVFRMEKNVPLVVPEINPEEIKRNKGIISNPNCTTIQAVVALKPLQDKIGIKRIVYSTYQAVSGSGLGGLKDLEEGNIEFYPYNIQYNTLPHIDSFLDNGYTKEEMKLVDETRKILQCDWLKITATAVRVPVRYSHSISINLELKKEFQMEEVFSVLKNAPGLVVRDKVDSNIYPMPLEAQGTDEVYVGRIRRDFSIENGLNLWVVADNIRKGAATNAVQIAELLIKTL